MPARNAGCHRWEPYATSGPAPRGPHGPPRRPPTAARAPARRRRRALAPGAALRARHLQARTAGDGRPARAAYAANEAPAFPDESTTISRTPCARSHETVTAVPRSLNEPLGRPPSSFAEDGPLPPPRRGPSSAPRATRARPRAASRDSARPRWRPRSTNVAGSAGGSSSSSGEPHAAHRQSVGPGAAAPHDPHRSSGHEPAS